MLAEASRAPCRCPWVGRFALSDKCRQKTAKAKATRKAIDTVVSASIK